MSLLLALLLAQTATAPPPPAEDNVVVTAQRLKRLDVVARADRKTGTTRCIVKRTSGSPALDAKVCDALLVCTKDATTVAAVRGCMAPTMDPLVGTRPWQASDVRGR